MHFFYNNVKQNVKNLQVDLPKEIARTLEIDLWSYLLKTDTHLSRLFQ